MLLDSLFYCDGQCTVIFLTLVLSFLIAFFVCIRCINNHTYVLVFILGEAK